MKTDGRRLSFKKLPVPELVANAQTSDIVASTNDYSRIIVSLLTGVNSIAGTCLKGQRRMILHVAGNQ